MLSLITLCLTISAGSIEQPRPSLPPWPKNLPNPVAAPCGECLPIPLADATHYRLEACERLSSRWQTHEAGLRAVLGAECDARVTEARIAAPGPTSASLVGVWLAGTSAAVGLLVGLLSGFALAH